jgi:hypothetical protein
MCNRGASIVERFNVGLQQHRPIGHVLQPRANKCHSKVFVGVVDGVSLDIKAFDNTMMDIHGDLGPTIEIQFDIKLWCLSPHPFERLRMSACSCTRYMESTHTKLIIALPDIRDIKVLVANRFGDIDFAYGGVHLSKDFLQARFVSL